MTTLSLEASKKLFNIVGFYPTERIHVVSANTGRVGIWTKESVLARQNELSETYPAPNFAELIRVLPKIGWQKRETAYPLLTYHSNSMLNLYMTAPTEPEGMAAVESYLMKLL